jgi:hypothetical protein
LLFVYSSSTCVYILYKQTYYTDVWYTTWILSNLITPIGISQDGQFCSYILLIINTNILYYTQLPILRGLQKLSLHPILLFFIKIFIYMFSLFVNDLYHRFRSLNTMFLNAIDSQLQIIISISL